MEPLIAIVDDDKAVRDALQRMLRAHGFVASVFASAERFLSSTDAACASCLIADMRMPGMTGLDLHNHLMANGVRVPTILITARPTSTERRRAISVGIACYLAKPLGEQILLDTVREALDNAGPIASASPTGQGSPRT